jgi:outer membrane lipoprotein SlyB
MELTGLRKTHPLVLGAAASVMVVSLVGAAAIGGLLPNARSDKTDPPTQRTDPPAQRSVPATDSAPQRLPRYATGDSACASCGTVDAIHSVELKGNATGLGAVAGGVTGAVIGHQIGRGNGNAAMTLLGAAGGALAGNEIEKNVKKQYSFRVTVRMDDGSFRAISQSAAPTVAVGDRVRIAHGALVAHS